MDVSTFRAGFPEFNNGTKFPDSLINFWLTVGTKLLNCDRWGDLLEQGLSLYIAHNITLAAQAQKDASVGGAPGASKGPTSAKAVDKVSISYDTQASIEESAGYYNLTTYGTQFIRLARLMGAGGIQVGGECAGYPYSYAYLANP